MSQRPAPRPVDKWEKAEENAATWMRHWGYNDAQVTPPGSDRGIDVRAGSALAQVKWAGKPVGRDAVQKLFGARGLRHDKALLFFTGPGHGYSQPAIEDADKLGVALFKYDIQGAMTPVNGSAQRIMQAARGAEGAVAVADRRPDLSDEPKPAGSGCALFLAVFFTLAVAGSIIGTVVGAAAGDSDTSQDLAIRIVLFGLFAGVFWMTWLGMRSGKRNDARPAADPAEPEAPEVPVFDGDSRPIDRVLSDSGALDAPFTDGEMAISPADVPWFEYRASVAVVIDALTAIHAKGGGRRPGVDMQNSRVTIAPDWITEYTGLVSITADMEPVNGGADIATRISWSFHSNATPSTMEEVVDEGQAAVERANNILAHLLGQTAQAGFEDGKG